MTVKSESAESLDDFRYKKLLIVVVVLAAGIRRANLLRWFERARSKPRRTPTDQLSAS